MKTLHRHLLAAGLLATLGLGAIAQTAQPPAAPGRAAEMHAHRGAMDPAQRMERRQMRMERRLADLKAKLQLAPAQEGAWTAWATAMMPKAKTRPNREEIARLPTPERIDTMRALRAQRMAEQDKRGDATKQFYATLTADQKRVFDAETVRGGKHGGRGMRHHG
jgi:protein CpxP